MHVHHSATHDVAKIAVPTAPADVAEREDSDAALFELLRDFARKCGVGKNDNETVIALIHVCIAEGLDTRRRMVGALTRLGFTKQQQVFNGQPRLIAPPNSTVPLRL